MEEPFDPYVRWLAIRDPKRPPNHYRLLGIDLFESDTDVIQNAADRQMTHIRSFQSGKHSAESQRILNELAAAKICLLSPEKKAAYDSVLRAEVRPTLRVTTPPPVISGRGVVTPPPLVDPSLTSPARPPVASAPRPATADVAIPAVPFSSLGLNATGSANASSPTASASALGATGSASALPQPTAVHATAKTGSRPIIYSAGFLLGVSVAIIAITLAAWAIWRSANRNNADNPPPATAQTAIAPPSK